MHTIIDEFQTHGHKILVTGNTSTKKYQLHIDGRKVGREDTAENTKIAIAAMQAVWGLGEMGEALSDTDSIRTYHSDELGAVTVPTS